MELRRYRQADCEEVLRLFYETVHRVNARDYTPQQLAVWATGREDAEAWNRSLSAHATWVAVDGKEIVGFGDMDPTGYLDRLYVHKDHQGRGIATAICDALEAEVDCGLFYTHASITARGFFEGRGYRVVEQRQVWRQGICLTNFRMEKAKQR